MEIEKRGDVTPEEAAAARQNDTAHKPVLKYLIILFLIAFALIFLSFFMHQHSNAEVLKELQSQVETLQELQNVEEEYTAAKAENEKLQDQLTQAEQETETAEMRQEAMTLLWQLDRAAAANDEGRVNSLLQALKKDDLYLLLPEADAETPDSLEAPRAAYDRIVLAASGYDGNSADTAQPAAPAE